MDININTSKVTPSLSAILGAAEAESIAKSATSKPILSGNNLTVSSANGSDPAKILALLLAETNEVRKNTTSTKISSLSVLFSSSLANITDSQKKARENLDAATDALDKAEKATAEAQSDLNAINTEINELKDNLRTASNALSQAQTALQEATKAYREIAQLPGESDTDFARRKTQTRKALDAAQKNYNSALRNKNSIEQQLSDAQNRLTNATQKLNDASIDEKLKNSALISAVNNLDSASYRVLTDALRLSSDEIDMIDPLEAKDEEKEKASLLPYSERSPLEIIRDSLRHADGDLLDSLEARRELTI